VADRTALLQIRLPQAEKDRLKSFCGPRDMSPLVREAITRYLNAQQAPCGKCGRVAWVCGYGEAQKGGPAVPLCGDCF
jgi:hypothetical protein